MGNEKSLKIIKEKSLFGLSMSDSFGPVLKALDMELPGNGVSSLL